VELWARNRQVHTLLFN